MTREERVDLIHPHFSQQNFRATLAPSSTRSCKKACRSRPSCGDAGRGLGGCPPAGRAAAVRRGLMPEEEILERLRVMGYVN